MEAMELTCNLGRNRAERWSISHSNIPCLPGRQEEGYAIILNGMGDLTGNGLGLFFGIEFNNSLSATTVGQS
jgi:hypothetical protein